LGEAGVGENAGVETNGAVRVVVLMELPGMIAGLCQDVDIQKWRKESEADVEQAGSHGNRMWILFP